jgi:GT2 family glycosyltransferase
MKLSVVIVNYNVKYFLEQCIHSIQKAMDGLSAEIYVVDNNSVDGSVRMIREKFHEVHLIENKENKGFSRANNQAIRKAKGEYILILNPDTILEDDTLVKCVKFMDSHPEAGGLGVQMIDGKGKFLPESKRGLPSPSVAFYKMFGFSALFPRSRIFSKYHLGYLDKDRIHEVDVLAGAFMMVRKSVLEEIGLLDEDFFMYGEDIDLSYRITRAGYKNYYYPLTRIIHYKGESTRKSSLNYVFLFYNAMIIFARKHFSKENARMFSLLINLAIYLRAFISIMNRFLSRLVIPFSDALLIYGGIWFIKGYWEKHLIFQSGGHYPMLFTLVAVPAYILIWLTSVYLSGGYDKPIRLRRIIQGMAIGTVIILVLYSLLPEYYRFSRALIIFGAVWGVLSMMFTRLILHVLNINQFRINEDKNKRFIIIGEKQEAERVSELLQKTIVNPSFIGLVSFQHHRVNANGFIGHIGQIKEIIWIHNINEVIFCAKDIPAQMIMDQMSELKDLQVDYKIAPPESLSIIGSNSINTSGDLYVIDINAITKIGNLRNKRLLDLVIASCLLLFYPVLFFAVRNPPGLLRNIFLVILSLRSWVGYSDLTESETHRLPGIKKGVLNPFDAFRKKPVPGEAIARLNLLYARDYKITNDINIILKGFRDLGRR